MQDIANREDIELLIQRFYKKVQADEVLAEHFSHVNWDVHLPTMYNFWASTVLGEQSYHGAPFTKHAPLNINTIHFDRWLHLFHETVDELFEGDRATEIKDRARNISQIFQHKMNLMKEQL